MALAVVANRDSYRSYFQDDDFGTLNWARVTPFHQYLTDLPCLAYPCQHGRPVGFMLYGALYPRAHLNYTPWALAMLALGLVNVALLWRLLTALEFDEIATALGCLVFVAARALFDGWWKPMFVYDVLSTTFALAMLLAYIRGRWVVSFVALWLAMRTKEIAIVLPAVLLCYEFTLGRRNWKRLIPFFIPAAIYGFYGILFNQSQPPSPYTMTSAPAALWRSISFYSSKVFGLLYAGFALALALFVTRDPRIRFALAAILFEIGMYLLMPDRMLEVYLYLAMTSVAMFIATLATYHRRNCRSARHRLGRVAGDSDSKTRRGDHRRSGRSPRIYRRPAHRPEGAALRICRRAGILRRVWRGICDPGHHQHVAGLSPGSRSPAAQRSGAAVAMEHPPPRTHPVRPVHESGDPCR